MDGNQVTSDPQPIPADIKLFLDNLLNEANISTIDDNQRQRMIQELYQNLDNFIATAIMDNLPPEKLDEFIKINEQKAPAEEVEKYLTDNMPNAQMVLAAAFLQFKEDYLGRNKL